MKTLTKTLIAPAFALAITTANAMDHSKMDHSTMDHSKMNHSMDHSAHNHHAHHGSHASAFENAKSYGSEQNKKPATPNPFPLTLHTGEQLDLRGLTDHTGSTIDDAYMQDIKNSGNNIALYFGFPDCNAFCPPSMATFTKMPEDSQLIFITSQINPSTKDVYSANDMQQWLNGERDGTQEWLGTLPDSVSQKIDIAFPNAIALTGPAELLQDITDTMHVIYKGNDKGVHSEMVTFFDTCGDYAGRANPIRESRTPGFFFPNFREFFKQMDEALPEKSNAVCAPTLDR